VTEDDRRDRFADIFTVALIKGAVEGDSYHHFGSLGGVAQHLPTARRLGLIDPEDEHTATARAQALYRRHQLNRLPEGRAYWYGTARRPWTRFWPSCCLNPSRPSTTFGAGRARAQVDSGAGRKAPVPRAGSTRHRDSFSDGRRGCRAR
jgi:hypothetical protein